MTNGIRVYLPLFVGLCLAATPILRSQEFWREVVLSGRQGPIPTLRAIAIPATVECNGQKLKAYVVLWAHVKPDGLGYPSLGVFVANLRDVIPPSELDQFDGPDLSDAVKREKTKDITVASKKMRKTISTRMILQSGDMFPSDVRGGEDDYLEMGVWPAKQDENDWKQLIIDMSSGFDEGHLTIGGRLFSHKLNVEFSGAGVQPVLKKLIASVGP